MEERGTVSLNSQQASYGAAGRKYPGSPIAPTNGVLMTAAAEAFPRVGNYKTGPFFKRPSIGQLHGETEIPASPGHGVTKFTISSALPEEKDSDEDGAFKLGWIQGVLIPCLLNIWGVMLFLRMPWITGQAGIIWSFIIIIISTAVCAATTLSLSALCTNGEVKGGGIYFIISRSLGPGFGASVGIVLAFANAVSASLNTIGFCESFVALLKTNYDYSMFDNVLNSYRVVGIIAILIMIAICAVGIEWESKVKKLTAKNNLILSTKCIAKRPDLAHYKEEKYLDIVHEFQKIRNDLNRTNKAQNFLIAFIIIAMVDFFVGTVIGPQGDLTKIARGFSGLSWDLVKENLLPDYRILDNKMQDISSVFAIFFPSVTGIQAGANISGDLKDPSSSIPKGTLLSLLVSMISYLAVVAAAGSAAVRDASGIESQVRDGTYRNCTIQECKFGLQNDYEIMQMMSVWGIIIYVGCFAATLSTALTNLLTVPRLLKALGDDRVYPGLSFFSKPYGPNNEPLRGYVITFIISAGFVLIANLNAIAPLISSFYLASYALINFCTFHAALVEPLGWRPTFKYYNKWLSLVSCILCVVIMFFIDWTTSLVTVSVFFTLYLLVMYRQPDINWGSSTDAQLYKSTLANSYRLNELGEHVKNYQPHILLFSGHPAERPVLLQLANLITKKNALLICAQIMTDKLTYKERKALLEDSRSYLKKSKVKAFVSLIDGLNNFEEAARALMQCSGIGKLKPNILMLGYKNDWNEQGTTGKFLKPIHNYFRVIRQAFDNRFAVVIVRMPMTTQKMITVDLTSGTLNEGFTQDSDDHLQDAFSNADSESVAAADVGKVFSMPANSPCPPKRSHKFSGSSYNLERKKKISVNSSANVPAKLNTSIFSMKSSKKMTVDVWWIYDDGGLTILLPYILNKRSIWPYSRLRIFALSDKFNENDIQQDKNNMIGLLEKLRIKFDSLEMLSDVDVPRGKEGRELFDRLIKPYIAENHDNGDNTSTCSSNGSDFDEFFVRNEQQELLREKTNRHLRLRELLIQHSQNSADLIVMSLPMPRKGVVSASIYMCWLEVLSHQMPPFVFIRGNQTSVLTYYS